LRLKNVYEIDHWTGFNTGSKPAKMFANVFETGFQHWDNVCREISSYSQLKKKTFRGQASWVKMTSSGGKLTAMACQPTKK